MTDRGNGGQHSWWPCTDVRIWYIFTKLRDTWTCTAQWSLLHKAGVMYSATGTARIVSQKAKSSPDTYIPYLFELISLWWAVPSQTIRHVLMLQTVERPPVIEGSCKYIVQYKQSRTADKGWYSSLQFGQCTKNSSLQECNTLRNTSQSLGWGGGLLWLR
jgi:hypothetical protein